MRRLLWPSAVWFFILWLHSSGLEPSDDEAYYWVLGQNPDWGFAYHPPVVAVLIWISQHLFEPLFGSAHPASLRFFSCLGSSLIFGLGTSWAIRMSGLSKKGVSTPVFLILSLAGFFGASWMMVPDIPLFLGWILAFTATSHLIENGSQKPSSWILVQLGAGVALALASKFSGALIIVSVASSLWIWTRGRVRWRALSALAVATALGCAPMLLWNATHEWAAFAYQFKERHEQSIPSLTRYGRFLGSQMLMAGIPLMGYAITRLWTLQKASRPVQLAFVWAMPASLYLIQPVFSDFKPHWAMAFWFPCVLAWAAEPRPFWKKLKKVQIAWGMGFTLFFWVACHFPLTSWLHRAWTGQNLDPRYEIAGSFAGWGTLKQYLPAQLPVVGARYQTAARAAFALGSVDQVTQLPLHHLRERWDWPDLGISEGRGPQWPRLTHEILYVGDLRYAQPPQFPGAHCEVFSEIPTSRWGILIWKITTWRCRGPKPETPAPPG